MPDSARGVLAEEALLGLQAFAGWLADDGVVRGLIGPREVPRLWDRHLLNCAALAEVMPEEAVVADVGSGAGLPGLVLALVRPDLQVTLIEPLLRRTAFLSEVVADLGLDRVTVHRGRADSLHDVARFDVVTSRAVAPLDRLLEWSMPLVAPTGALVAMKGESAAEEVAATRATWSAWGCADPEVLTLTGAGVERPTCAVRVAWADPASVSWPIVPPGASRRGIPRSSSGRSANARKRRQRRDR